MLSRDAEGAINGKDAAPRNMASRGNTIFQIAFR